LVKSTSPESWVIGIDDTDMPDIGGTGRLARRIAAEAETLGLGHSTGVTRHQFYEGPGVPKTARNSAAAIAFDDVGSASELFEKVCGIVTRESIEGSDPGVAIGNAVVPDLINFARRAQGGLVTQAEARQLGDFGADGLVGLGGTEDGVIGALGAMALRLDGNDGRFVDLPGIRDVAGAMSVAEILEQTGVVDVVDTTTRGSLAPASTLDLGDWVRPRLVGGQPVLVAKLSKEKWVNADSRKK
jgi:hypothetical protein